MKNPNSSQSDLAHGVSSTKTTTRIMITLMVNISSVANMETLIQMKQAAFDGFELRNKLAYFIYIPFNVSALTCEVVMCTAKEQRRKKEEEKEDL